MKILRGLKPEHLVGIDIESVRVVDDYNDLPDDLRSAWVYKNKQNNVIPSHQELWNLWRDTASLYPEFSKVCSVSLTFLGVGRTKLFCRNFTHTDERALLIRLAGVLNSMYHKDRSYRLIGHAAKYFDYPFLAKRCIINGIPIPEIIDHTAKKPWDLTNLDTNELWKMGGTGPGSSLVAICAAMGIPISKCDMQGADVGEYFYQGNLDGIAKYCDQDTVAVLNIPFKLMGYPLWEFDQVTYIKEDFREVDDVAGEVLRVPVADDAMPTNMSNPVTEADAFEESPVLTRIFTTRSFTEEDKKELTDIFCGQGKHVTKKDWEMLDMTLRSLYISDTFGKADLKAVREAKTAEIDEFMLNIKSIKDA